MIDTVKEIAVICLAAWAAGLCFMAGVGCAVMACGLL